MALLSLVAKLGLDSTGFQQGINNASKQASQFGSSLKATLAAAFSVAAVGAFVRNLGEAVGRIKDLSEQFGVTTTEIQNVDFALKQSGMAFEDFGQAMSKMGQARRDAVEGNMELRATFEKYGLTVEKLNNPQLRSFDLLMMMSEAMSGMNITAREQVEIQDILGPRAAKLANILGSLSTTKPPEIFKDEDIERIDKAGKSLDKVYTTIQKMAAGPIGRFAESLDKSLQEWSSKPGKWWQKIFTTDAKGGALSKAVIAGLFGEDKKPAAVVPAAAAAAGAPVQNAKPPEQVVAEGLFEIDKNLKKTKQVERAMLPLQSADQLGRIGAFSGGASNNVVEQVKKTTATLVEIKRVLEFKGIVVKDL